MTSSSFSILTASLFASRDFTSVGHRERKEGLGGEKREGGRRRKKRQNGKEERGTGERGKKSHDNQSHAYHLYTVLSPGPTHVNQP